METRLFKLSAPKIFENTVFSKKFFAYCYVLYVGVAVPKTLPGKGSPTLIKLMFPTKIDLTKKMALSKFSYGAT